MDWERLNARGRESVTQAIGRAAAGAGFEGLIVPSAAEPGARNLVVFVDLLGPGGLVTVDDAG